MAARQAVVCQQGVAQQPRHVKENRDQGSSNAFEVNLLVHPFLNSTLHINNKLGAH